MKGAISAALMFIATCGYAQLDTNYFAPKRVYYSIEEAIPHKDSAIVLVMRGKGLVEIPQDVVLLKELRMASFI